jgi:tRNA-splicing ligase RtcB
MEIETPYIEDRVDGGVPVRRWTRGVPVDVGALDQLANTAKLPVVGPYVAAMPDVHVGIGATVGSVVPTRGAIIPAAVGVDIGCGMIASRTTLVATDLPDTLRPLRNAIERAVPHGFAKRGRDRGRWERSPPAAADMAWTTLADEFGVLCATHPTLARTNHRMHLGTLGSGNHFIEICLDEADRVWVMLHSGSRGVGNAIGQHFIALAREAALRDDVHLPDRDLAWFAEGTQPFDDYVRAVGWAQRYAAANRAVMLDLVLDAMRGVIDTPFDAAAEAVNCHHNYVQRERHFDLDRWITRKGAVSARAGELGIIPGSMGARSFIVRGKGCADSFTSCSHGAGRVLSRSAAHRRLTLDDHVAATAGVECRKDAGVLDESPAAYKDIGAVMAAQADLVEVVHTLKQVVCVKG